MKVTGENRISLSVTELVRFAAAGGDIDLRFAGEHRRSMNIGAAVHRRIQKSAGALYVPEVPLSYTTVCDGIEYTVSGRADGIIETPDGEVTIDEIKTTRIPPEMIASDVHEMHFSQGAIYAWFYCFDKHLGDINVRLTYYDTEDDKIYKSIRDYSASDVKNIFYSMLHSIEPIARAALERENKVPTELKDVPFPYEEKREGQRDMVIESYRTIKRGGRLFVSAPTGIGKTISSIYPALKAVGTGDADKIFYLCAKGVIANQAAEAVAAVGSENIRAMILSARVRMCSSKVKPSGTRAADACNPMSCPAARGHYSRSKEALSELLSKKGIYTPQMIRAVAEKYRVCPYELSLDLSEFCTVVICDYNYLFSPRVKLRRYFDDGGVERLEPSERFVFLIDEAHNLVSRARDMYSAELTADDVSAFCEVGGAVSAAANQLCTAIDAQKKNISETEYDPTSDTDGAKYGAAILPSAPEQITEAAEAFCRSVVGWVAGGIGVSPELTEAYYRVYSYLTVAKNADERYVTFIEMQNDQIKCRLMCADPSAIISKCLDVGRAAIFFSATLTPIEYYVNVLSGPDSADTLELESPFPPENFSVYIADRFSTRFSDRDTSTTALADMIAAAVGAKKGNYIAYFPSYGYMESVYKKFSKRYPSVTTVIQKRDSGERERSEFLASFVDDGERRVFFCVLGGIYSEGIDLSGERLIGVIIVGTGIGQLSSERNVIAEYYEKKYEMGFDYAYTYPGMNRVLQAAGRVIRGENDRGIVVLVDDRYADGKYMELFPGHWENIKLVGDAPSLREAVKRFWNETEQ